jgi:nucleoid-associated protein YgaU
MTIGIVFDHFTDQTPGTSAGTSAEPAIALLEKLALPSSSMGQPPRITLLARGGHVPHQDKQWVIDSLTWLDGATMNSNGHRTRQAATLSLFEYRPDFVVRSSSHAKRARAKAKATKTKPGATHKRRVVKQRKAIVQAPSLLTDSSDFGQGEDLLTIAADELGDADRWTEIAELNDMRDPRATFPGQVLRLP